MGVFDDYINGLEGQTEIDPLKVVQELTELHTNEVSTREAKIGELSEAQVKAAQDYEQLQRELAAQKARNWDLAAQLPGTDGKPHAEDHNNGPITISDLFA